MHKTGFLASCGLMLLVSVTNVNAQDLSTSKLSVHLDFHYTNGARQVIAAGPQVLKILDLTGEMLSALRDYKAAYPNGLSVLRIYTRQTYRLQDDPVASADDFWNRILWPPLSRLSDNDRQLIDFLE